MKTENLLVTTSLQWCIKCYFVDMELCLRFKCDFYGYRFTQDSSSFGGHLYRAARTLSSL